MTTFVTTNQISEAEEAARLQDAKDVAGAAELGCSVAVYRMLMQLQQQNTDLANRCATLEEWCGDVEALTGIAA